MFYVGKKENSYYLNLLLFHYAIVPQFPCGLNKTVISLVQRTFRSAILDTGFFQLGSKVAALGLVHSYQQEAEKESRNCQL